MLQSFPPQQLSKLIQNRDIPSVTEAEIRFTAVSVSYIKH